MINVKKGIFLGIGILGGIIKTTVEIHGRRIFCDFKIACNMASGDDLMPYFQKLIIDNKILIFSKTTCPFCNKVKKLFTDLEEDFYCVELNTFTPEKCSQMQNVLQEMSGQRTVPNVYINKHHVGGCTDTQQALADGTLYDMLEGSFQTYDFDYVVLGGGSGGLASAKEAASYNQRVAVCDLVLPSPQGTTWGLGGTCVNVGCIPKKLMHKAAIVGEDLNDAPYFGWTTECKEHSWSDMVINIQNYIRSLNWKYRRTLKEKNVTYFDNFAKFEDKHTLGLYNKRGEKVKSITGHNFLLATGGRPVYPEFPGAKELCISSDDIFSLTEPPGKTLLIGASYIALETAGFLAGLGFDTTVMVRSILLRGFDQEIATMIGKNLEDHGVKFIYKAVPKCIVREPDTGLLKVSFSSCIDGSVHEEIFKTVFLAVGREACTKGIGLDKLGVDMHKDGRVHINDRSQSSVRNIFAVGDIIEEKYQLTPVAILAGKFLAQRLYGKKTAVFDYNMVPTTVFTPLEYGAVGLSEEAAIDKYGKDQIEVYHIHFQPLEWELPSRNKDKSFAKLVCLKTMEELVVGFHYLGPNAGEVTQGFALGLKLGAKKEDFSNLVGIHPTCAEIFTTMTVSKSSGKSPTAGGC